MLRYTLAYKSARINVLSDKDLRVGAQERLESEYRRLEDYLAADEFFKASFTPVKAGEIAPRIARVMADAAAAAGTGPMAAVAGAIAESVGGFLASSGCRDVVAENGGDIYLKLEEEKTVGLHAGNSPFSDKLAFKIKPSETPLGVCTSAANVGHSISLGEADAVTCFADSAPLADAAATAVANEVKGADGIHEGIKKAGKIPGLKGVLLIKGEELASWGWVPEIVDAGETSLIDF